MAHYRIIKWGEHQHYRDRSPPWIKLHANTLTSQTWVGLDNDGRALAVACMLIAADTNNQIPVDPAFIRRRAYFDAVPDFAPLVAVGFIELVGEIKDLAQPPQASASTTLASGTKCSSESEGEAEQSREEQKGNSTAAKPGADKRGTRLTDDWQLTDELRAFAVDLGLDPDETRAEFVDHWTSVPGSKGLKLSWPKTFKNRCRQLGKKPSFGRGESASDKRAREVQEAIERSKLQ